MLKNNKEKWFQNRNLNKLIWPLLALVLILLFNLFFTKGFFNLEIKEGRLFGSLVDILNRAAPVMLLSIGMTLVFATGGIDLSVGAVIAISGSLAAQIIRPQYILGILDYPNPPAPLFIIIAIPLLVSLLAGFWNGFLVSVIQIQPIIATLILMVAGRGIAQIIVNGQQVFYVHQSFQFLGSGFLLGLPFPVIIAFSVLLFTYLLTRKTPLGMFIEAIGGNPVASRYLGIKTNLIKIMVYMFCSFCAGIAGLIYCADVASADANNAGLFLELDAIASVIIGGTIWGGRYTLAGSIIGTLIIQSLTTTILTRGVPPEVNLVFKAIVIIIVALIQSEKLRKNFFDLYKKIPGLMHPGQQTQKEEKL